MKGAADNGKHSGRVGGRRIGAVDHGNRQQIAAANHGSRWSSRLSQQQMEQQITVVGSRSRDRGWLLGVSFSRVLKRVH